jgi:Lipocalin-like domain
MKAKRRLVLASIAGTAFIAAAPQALAQQKDLKKQIVGEWTLVSAYNERDGKKREQFGPNPAGYLYLGPSGRFAFMVFAKAAPKFTGNDRAKATGEEAQAVIRDSVAYFGTYKVDEQGALELNIQHSTFPNLIGAGKRIVKVKGDELSLVNPGARAGGSNNQVWKRVK